MPPHWNLPCMIKCIAYCAHLRAAHRQQSPSSACVGMARTPMRRMARICNAKCILTSQACTRFSSARSVCFIAPSERESRTSRASHRSHVSPRWPCTPMSRVPRTQPQWKHQPHDARVCLLQALQRRSAQGGNTAFFNSAIPVFLQVSALGKIRRVWAPRCCCYYYSQWF